MTTRKQPKYCLLFQPSRSARLFLVQFNIKEFIDEALLHFPFPFHFFFERHLISGR